MLFVVCLFVLVRSGGTVGEKGANRLGKDHGFAPPNVEET